MSVGLQHLYVVQCKFGGEAYPVIAATERTDAEALAARLRDRMQGELAKLGFPVPTITVHEIELADKSVLVEEMLRRINPARRAMDLDGTFISTDDGSKVK